MEWACSECPKKKYDDLDPYTTKLLSLAAMQRGGYPFQANDMTIEEWIDLGRIKDVLQPKQHCPMMRRK